MPDYAIFGGCFRSDLSFPELPPHPGGVADWALRIVASPPLHGSGTLIGEDHIPGSMHVRLFRMPEGFRLAYDDTGTFDIPDGGAEILWCPGAEANEDAARLDVIGYGFATAFHAAGTLCLHGSAVGLQSGGVAFVAPKLHGKSTLAHALVEAGARLATDDALPVSIGNPPMMRPGIHQIRLRSDSAARLIDGPLPARAGYGGKHVLTDINAEHLVHEELPLSAIYILAPVRADGSAPAAERHLLSPVEATVHLVRQNKGGLLLGKSESPVILQRAAALARGVPVYRLRIVRDFERLPDVVEQLLQWHGAAAPIPAVSASYS
ncbi:MAG: hypothetical protein H0X65_06360 [Gemmatimonadetes bacterium]|jgi:hypothetical protein|nr:hypothetical protein [Gemmatimonadota bacterium]